MRVLMLGGARDEVVPRSQMQELWAIIRSRGRARDAEKPDTLSIGEKTKAAARGKRVGNDDNDDDSLGPDDPKAPPRVVTDGGNKYIEFGAGTHSEWFFFFFSVNFVALKSFYVLRCKTIRVSNRGIGPR